MAKQRQDRGSGLNAHVKRWLDYPQVWMLGFLLAVVLLDVVLPWGMFGASGAVVGLGLMVVGLAIMGKAVLQMVRRRTTVDPRGEPSALVTGGIFRFSRNPIYLGDALVLAGVIMWLDVPLAAPLLPVFMLVIQHRFILVEEARLRKAFGADFDRWASRTRRWL